MIHAKTLLSLQSTLDAVLAIELAARRNLMLMPEPQFRAMVSDCGWLGVEEAAGALRSEVAEHEAACDSVRKSMDLDGEVVPAEIMMLHVSLEAALGGIEDRALYSPFEWRMQSMLWPLAPPMTDDDLERAWSTP